MPTGPDMLFVPMEPKKPRSEWTNWAYVPVFHVAKMEYKKDTKVLVGTITAVLAETTEKRIRAKLREATGIASESTFLLTPVRIESLTAEVVLFKKREEILSMKNAFSVANELSIMVKIEDKDMQEQLASNLKEVPLAIRTTSPYRDISTGSIEVTSSIAVAREAFEKILPQGIKPEQLNNESLILDRDSARILKEKFKQTFFARVEGDQRKLSELTPILDRFIATMIVSEVPIYELTQEMIDRSFVWNSKLQQLESSPTVKKDLTTELTRSTEDFKKLKFVWDKMKEEANKVGTAEDWKKRIETKWAADGVFKSAFSGLGLSLSNHLGGAGGRDSKSSEEWNKTTTNEAYEKSKDGGELNSEAMSKALTAWKGKNELERIYPKTMLLRTATKIDLDSFRSAVVDRVEYLNTRSLALSTQITLESSNLKHEDYLTEIESFKKLLAQTVADHGAKANAFDQKIAQVSQKIERPQLVITSRSIVAFGAAIDKKLQEGEFLAGPHSPQFDLPMQAPKDYKIVAAFFTLEDNFAALKGFRGIDVDPSPGIEASVRLKLTSTAEANEAIRIKLHAVCVPK